MQCWHKTTDLHQKRIGTKQTGRRTWLNQQHITVSLQCFDPFTIFMFAELTNSPYLLAASLLLTLGTILAISGSLALFRARISAFLVQALIASILLLSGTISGAIALGINGYQSFTREEIAANISVSPIAPQRFTATLRYPDGQTRNFAIAGDELYIDAHILKWQPIANFFGLHTAYELERIGGRYREIEQERSAERTIHSLSLDKPVNLFSLRQQHPLLALFFDAKYGSATFVPITQTSEFQLKVSTTGLLMRELNNTRKPN